MELDEAIEIVEAYQHWVYKLASPELEHAIAVLLATAKVVRDNR